MDNKIAELMYKITRLENKLEHLEQMRLLDKVLMDQQILAVRLERMNR